jgi:hypothetical protein
VIDYLSHNGTIDVDVLYRSPFSTLAPGGPEDLFPEVEVDEMVATIHALNATAMPARRASRAGLRDALPVTVLGVVSYGSGRDRTGSRMSEDGRGQWPGSASVTPRCAVARRRTCAGARTPPMIEVQVTKARTGSVWRVHGGAATGPVGTD